jgi:hypothetical protein
MPSFSLYMQVELWRSDLMTGVLDVDLLGYVEATGIKGMPAYSPAIMLGLPTSSIEGMP